jgi:hypothetical protein
MFGLTNSSNNPRRKKKPRKNLEFIFDDLDTTPSTDEPMSTITPDKDKPLSDPAPRTTTDRTPESHASSTAAKKSTQPISSSTNQEKAPMDPTSIRTPRPIAKDNIKRQKREQSTINSLLNGIGLAFTCGILIVAALASLGGYVLYKQLSDQSASLALLEQNTKQRFFEMETDLIKRDTELARNLEQTNLRLLNMTASFEEFRSQSMEMLADLRANNKALAKQLTQARQENAAQRMQLAQLESSVRLRR